MKNQNNELIRAAYETAMNRLCKWRTVFVGWMLGTRASDEPGIQGHRDAVEARLITRVELSALVSLLVEKGIFTADEFMAASTVEAGLLEKRFEATFPGFRVDGQGAGQGISIDMTVAAETIKRLGFPP